VCCSASGTTGRLVLALALSPPSPVSEVGSWDAPVRSASLASVAGGVGSNRQEGHSHKVMGSGVVGHRSWRLPGAVPFVRSVSWDGGDRCCRFFIFYRGGLRLGKNKNVIWVF
jgi:hypothetical protein